MEIVIQDIHTMAKPNASPENRREEHSFTEQRVDMGGAVINKKSIGENREFQELWLLIG